MIDFKELKKGNFVFVGSGKEIWQGTVTGFNKVEKQIAVNNGTESYFYHGEDLRPIFVSDDVLKKLGFVKKTNSDGSIQYEDHDFTVWFPQENNPSRYELRYRDDTRHIMDTIWMHRFQNLYEEMTKEPLSA